ncbi:MAG: adenosine kinase [Magnetococcales bacterium]|nr:adenosine kinase [Magnetococcales bacterium]MBF0151324.1 adenosine kinase [Magnetococcales bacterium]MBF0174230.1 adenosine kinase [Magnetococcales bacterium]MBF0347261.1 adenosine kinase [Magnetococcales bacterium]MBF0632227.1 adenosine kinase [Magnetococcales bacterium]
MKIYDVYGIGHALVDIECHVDDSFLKEVGLQKGSMTLVDGQRQDLLQERLKNQMVHRSSGGSSANTMIGLAQLGGRCFHSCKTADDELGRFFIADMRANGVENDASLCDPAQGVTGRCMVMITPDAERTMCTHLGVSETFSVENLSEHALRQAKYLYVEGYLVSAEVTRRAAVEAAAMARSHGVRTALTFSDVSMINYFREGVDAIVSGGIDLLFCNENEALCYAGTDSLEIATRRLREIARSFCLTLGARGARLYHQGEELNLPGIEVKAVDTNGAGDLFAGAFLYGMTQGRSLYQAGLLAIHASAQLVTQYGARLKSGQATHIKKSLGVDHE